MLREFGFEVANFHFDALMLVLLASACCATAYLLLHVSGRAWEDSFSSPGGRRMLRMMSHVRAAIGPRCARTGWAGGVGGVGGWGQAGDAQGGGSGGIGGR